MFSLLSHQMSVSGFVAAREAEAADCICLGYNTTLRERENGGRAASDVTC